MVYNKVLKRHYRKMVQLHKLNKYIVSAIAMVIMTMAFSCFGGTTNSPNPSLITLPSNMPDTTLNLYNTNELEIRTAAAYDLIDNTPLDLTSVTKWGLINKMPNLGFGLIVGEGNSSNTTYTSVLLIDTEYRFILSQNFDLVGGAGVGYSLKYGSVIGEIHALFEFRFTKNSGSFSGASFPIEPNTKALSVMPVAGLTYSFK